MSNSTVRTASGLLVPSTAVERKQRVLHRDAFKRLVRFMRDMKAEAIAPLLVCTDCKKPIDLELVDKLFEVDDYRNTMPGGRPVLRCECSDRVVR